MYEYSDNISDPFFITTQAMKKTYSSSKYSQLIQEIPQAIDDNNDLSQIHNPTSNTLKLSENDFDRINNDKITFYQNKYQNIFQWNAVPELKYSTSIKNKMEWIDTSKEKKIDQKFYKTKAYMIKSQELKKEKFFVPILYKGRKVAESYIGYTIDCPIGNDSEILLSRFVIHGTSLNTIFTFFSLQDERLCASSENFFDAFQAFKNMIINLHIFHDEIPSLLNISPLKFVQIRPIMNEYYSITYNP